MLLYLGERSLENPDAAIREQEIGVEVFDRKSHYDTSQDTLVRVQASQLRKKLQQYFAEEGRDEPLLLEVPKGSYLTVFRPREAPPAPEPEVAPEPAKEPSRIRAIHWLAALAGVLTLCCGFLAFQNLSLQKRLQAGLGQKPLVDRFWKQLFGNGLHNYMALADGNLLVFQDHINQQMTLQEYESKAFDRLAAQRIADPVLRQKTVALVARHFTGVIDAELARRMGLVSASNGFQLDVVLAREMSTPQVASCNVILLGSRRANPWVALFEDKLNFRTVFEESPRVAYFRNTQPRPGESTEYRGKWNTLGYCRVAYLPNPKGTGSALILSGTDVQSTGAGGELILSEYWQNTLRNALNLKASDDMPFFEALLRVEVVNNDVPRFGLVSLRRH